MWVVFLCNVPSCNDAQNWYVGALLQRNHGVMLENEALWVVHPYVPFHLYKLIYYLVLLVFAMERHAP